MGVVGEGQSNGEQAVFDIILGGVCLTPVQVVEHFVDELRGERQQIFFKLVVKLDIVLVPYEAFS